MTRTKLSLLLALALLAGACGGGSSLATSADPASELVARCGSQVEFSSLPVDVNTFPPLDDDAQSAIDELVNGPTGVEAGEFADVEFSIANRTNSNLSLFGPSPDGAGFVNATFERRDGEWRPTSWGGCRIQISAPGFGPARTQLDPDVEPDPGSTTLNLVINEWDCASGQPPTDRQVIPVVIETAETIEIITMVEPVSGDAECPSNPWHAVTAELDAPLGNRTVLDGHMPPAQELSWPPDLNF